MSGAVGHECNLFGVGPAVVLGVQLVEERAEGVDYLQIGSLAVAAYCVGFAALSLFEDGKESAAVILDKEPVSDVAAVAVNRQTLSAQGVVDYERDELLGELIRSVVVGAVGDEDGETVGVPVGANKVIGGRLGS